MIEIRNFINKLSKYRKVTYLILILFFVISLLSIGVFTLVKYKTENTIITTAPVWTSGDPLANIQVGTYSWENLRYDLKSVKFDSGITFSIENLASLKGKYYYISNSIDALTQEEISQINSWNEFSSDVQISEEGFYVIYVKVVDKDDNIRYVNTDLLILDFSGSSVSVSMDGSTWLNLRDSLDYIYIDRPKYVTVGASDNLSGISSIKYYVTDQILNISHLNELSSSEWTIYSNEIIISEIGKHIVYVQVIDNCNHVTYVNTDYIILDGYTETSLIIGKNSSSYLDADAYITNKSAITLNINYFNTSSNYLNNHTHNLISNILLPLGTKITLLDHVENKVYEYQITTDTDIYNYNNSCDVEDLDCIKVATYPFTLFKEVGTGIIDKMFLENTYYDNGIVNENFTIVLDLFNTNISTNYNDVALYMELRDSNNINVRSTLYNTIKSFNIYSNVNNESADASLYLTTNYNENEIIYNSDSSTDINLTSKINYKYIGSFKITDTTHEDKEIGLAIKLVDGDENIVDKDYLKNIIFKVGNNVYYPEKDNIVRINLKSGIADVTKTLTIITNENNSNLEDGTYYFKISNYVSYDGYYYDELSDTELSIPVNVSTNNFNITYSFDVNMNDANRIINKSDGSIKVPLNILYNGSLKTPNIRISLYKKDQLTAYDQNYSIIDLANYVSDTLNKCASNIYYVSTNPVQYKEPENLYNIFELHLVAANFENAGYKFVFDLYDDTKKIGTIEKNFIVR